MKGRQFLFRMLLILAGILVLDVLCHYSMDFVRKKALQANPDNYEMTSYYGVEMASEELLVIGASTATHHYIPSMLQDSLHLSARNLGKDGAFLYCQICQLSLILERYTPKVVLWDINDDCLSHNQDWGDFMEISDYWPYPLNDFSKAIVKEMGPSQSVSMHSWLYRYNSKFPEYLFSFVSGRDSQTGYVPLPADASFVGEKNKVDTPENFHPLKAQLLESILSLCLKKGCKVILVTSPRFSDDGVQKSEQYQRLCDMTELLGIPYLNYHEDARFFDEPSLFRDADHLNENGAALFTACLIKDIRNLL